MEPDNSIPAEPPEGNSRQPGRWDGVFRSVVLMLLGAGISLIARACPNEEQKRQGEEQRRQGEEIREIKAMLSRPPRE